MSLVEYLIIWHQCSKEIDWQTEGELLKLVYKRFIPDGSEDDIIDVSSLLTKLEEKNVLGIDCLDVLKDLLKGIEKWGLIRMVEKFEIKRNDYKKLLEQIRGALEGSIEVERLISICRRHNLITHEREEHIVNIDALFTELEQHSNLRVGNLNILKTIATEVEKPDLSRLVDDFDEKRKREEDAERERKEREDYKRRARAQAASVFTRGINIGERVVGVVTPHCTFRNLTGGAVVVTTWMVLRRSPSMEAFVAAFTEAVLPFGNCLRAISEGSTRFTIQAENNSALDALWQSYQDETLRTNLQEFLVTEEIKQLAGGEVTLTVHIDEDEYRNAMLDLLISETEGMKLEGKRGLRDRATSDSDLLKERKMTADNTKDPPPEREFLPSPRNILVKEYLENLQETLSEITQPSDSGLGTLSSAPSEYRLDQGDKIERLDQVDDFFRLAIENLGIFQDTYPSEGNAFYKMGEEMKRFRNALETLKDMEKEWMNAEPILTSSSSPEVIIQKLLQLDEDYLEKLTSKEKTIVRGLVRKAKNLKRMDVFDHLRQITPRGTTGPRLPDDLPIEEIPERGREILSYVITYDLVLPDSSSWKPGYKSDSLDSLAKKNSLKTLGELYDFLCEHGLALTADLL